MLSEYTDMHRKRVTYLCNSFEMKCCESICILLLVIVVVLCPLTSEYFRGKDNLFLAHKNVCDMLRCYKFSEQYGNNMYSILLNIKGTILICVECDTVL